MLRLRAAAMAFALAGLSAGTITTATAGAAAATTAPAVPTLIQVSATRHYGHDQPAFQFRGGVPAKYSARYVSQVTGDASGLPVNVVGSAQPRLGRVVLDVKAPYRTVPVRDYFLNTHRFATGQAPYTTAVDRPVTVPATAFGAMQRLFAGPTQAELARGLKFVSSGATGFKILGIRDGVARVQLLGKICSGGSTFTIANQIMPTLKQFRSIHWVKIYDARGHTERPFGHSDSIPVSLEP
jgi:hypothetical protein